VKVKVGILLAVCRCTNCDWAIEQGWSISYWCICDGVA